MPVREYMILWFVRIYNKYILWSILRWAPSRFWLKLQAFYPFILIWIREKDIFVFLEASKFSKASFTYYIRSIWPFLKVIAKTINPILFEMLNFFSWQIWFINHWNWTSGLIGMTMLCLKIKPSTNLYPK